MSLWKAGKRLTAAEIDRPRWEAKMERKLMSGCKMPLHLSDREVLIHQIMKQTTIHWHEEVFNKSNLGFIVKELFCSNFLIRDVEMSRFQVGLPGSQILLWTG